MKYFTFPLLFLSLNFTVHAQSLQPSVIALSCGFSSLQNGSSMSWTVGEPVIHTLPGANFTLTQGFQQPLLEVTTSYYDPAFNYNFLAFPNPLQFELRLETDYPEDLRYFLYDVSGNVLRTHKFKQEETLDLRTFPAGVYVLKVMTLEKTIRSILIEKF